MSVSTSQVVCVNSEKICNVFGCFGAVSKHNTKEYFCDKHLEKCKLEVPEECSICMEKLTYKMHLQCGHCFHDDCIDTWLSSKSTCPLCRQKCNDWENDIKYQLGFPILERSDGYYEENYDEENHDMNEDIAPLVSDNSDNEMENEENYASNIDISYVPNNNNEFDNWIKEQIYSFIINSEYHDDVYNCIINSDYFLRQCFFYYNDENLDIGELNIFFNFIRISIFLE
jgi:hypothetical protein